MMNGMMGGWYSGMGSVGWTSCILVLVVVIAAVAVIVSRRKSQLGVGERCAWLSTASAPA